MTTVTIETMLAAADLIKNLKPRRRPTDAIINIVFTPHALKETNERLFPPSRHRSARIRKKLIKRFGGEFRKQPCMWHFQGTLYCHPALRARLEATIKGPRTAEAERISRYAGLDLSGEILPPDTSGGINRSEMSWWCNPWGGPLVRMTE